MGGEPFEFNGNVPNTGLDHQPARRGPASRCRSSPTRAGCTRSTSARCRASGAAQPDQRRRRRRWPSRRRSPATRRLVYQAIAYDPLTAAVLSLAEIKQMVDEMLAQNAAYLPQFGKLGA